MHVIRFLNGRKTPNKLQLRKDLIRCGVNQKLGGWMLSDLTNWILEIVRSHGMLGVIIGVLIEAIIVPIPSPLVMMTAGFALIEPGLALSSALVKILFVITIPASIAGVLANYVIYGVTYFGGRAVIDRYKRFLGFSYRDVIKVRKKFGKREGLSIFVLRAIPIVPISVVSAGAGVLKTDWKKFGLFSFLGLLPRNFVLAFIGWKLSEVYVAIANYIDNIETLVTLTIVGVVLLVFVSYKFKLIDRLQGWALK